MSDIRGPGQALTFHLDLLERVRSAKTWIDQHQNKKVRADRLPVSYEQRLMLMTSMSDWGAEGATTATQRDDPRQMHAPATLQRANGMLHQEFDFLRNGETWYVSQHISQSIWDAALLADPEPLFPTDLPSPQGLIVLQTPLVIPDLHPDTGEIIHDLKMPITAIGWKKSYVHTFDVAEDGTRTISEPKEGLVYVLYTDREQWRDIYIQSALKYFAKAKPEEVPRIKAVAADASYRDKTFPTDSSGWVFGIPWAFDADSTRDPVVSTTDEEGRSHVFLTVGQIRRWLLGLFRFTWQRILVPEPWRPDRGSMRRWQRSIRPIEDGYVKVLKLRRMVETTKERDSEAGFFHDHQFVVRGHWRRQHYSKLGPARNDDGSFNHDSHRLIYIDPHLSGNPYGPLVLGHDVTAVVR